MDSVYYVGLDVHKDSIRMAVLNEKEKESVYEATFENDIPRVLRKIAHFREKGEVVVAYEAGCMGYTLQRSLGEAHIECRVLPANKIDRSAIGRVKTDARDALVIARMIKHNEADSILIPTEADEEARDLLRCREDMKAERQRTRHQLSNFLLRHGQIYQGKIHWTGAHVAWMKKLSFGSLTAQDTFDQYFCHLLELNSRLDRIDEKIIALAQNERYHDAIARLRCFKGIEYLTALACIVEVGDYRRFPSAGSFMAYLGLVPSEYSSGNKRQQGGITKTGNSHLRKLLIEAGWHYRHRFPANAALIERRKGMDERIITYADKATHRLQSKFWKMTYRGKSAKTAVTAAARELAGFIWGMMTEAYF